MGLTSPPSGCTPSSAGSGPGGGSNVTSFTYNSTTATFTIGTDQPGSFPATITGTGTNIAFFSPVDGHLTFDSFFYYDNTNPNNSNFHVTTIGGTNFAANVDSNGTQSSMFATQNSPGINQNAKTGADGNTSIGSYLQWNENIGHTQALVRVCGNGSGNRSIIEFVYNTTVWQWPTVDGTSGQVLSTDGAGHMSWITAGGGGITYNGPVIGGHNNEVLYISNSGTLTSDNRFTRGGTMQTQIQSRTGPGGTTGTWSLDYNNISWANANSGGEARVSSTYTNITTASSAGAGVTIGTSHSQIYARYDGTSILDVIMEALNGGTTSSVIANNAGVFVEAPQLAYTYLGNDYMLLDPISLAYQFGAIASGNTTKFVIDDSVQKYTLNKLGGSGSGFVTVDNAGVLGFSATAGSISIGSPVGSGIPNAVLYLDAASNLANNINFTFDQVANVLTFTDGAAQLFDVNFGGFSSDLSMSDGIHTGSWTVSNNTLQFSHQDAAGTYVNNFTQDPSHTQHTYLDVTNNIQTGLFAYPTYTTIGYHDLTTGFQSSNQFDSGQNNGQITDGVNYQNQYFLTPSQALLAFGNIISGVSMGFVASNNTTVTGSIGGSGNGTNILLDDSSPAVAIRTGTGSTGLLLDFVAGEYTTGDNTVALRSFLNMRSNAGDGLMGISTGFSIADLTNGNNPLFQIDVANHYSLFSTGMVYTQYNGNAGGTTWPITSADYLLYAQGPNVTYTLPPLASIRQGQVFIIKDELGNASPGSPITIIPFGTEFIENVNAPYLITIPFGSVTIINHAAQLNWAVV